MSDGAETSLLHQLIDQLILILIAVVLREKSLENFSSSSRDQKSD